MAVSEAWLGIDLGTQSVRAMVVSAGGRVMGEGSQPITQDWRDGSRHEQDPEEWWRATVAATRASLQHLSRCEVRGIAVDATSGTVLLTNRNGRPLTRGLMYDDGRAVEILDEVNAAGNDVWERLGYQMQASWALPKLTWLARQERNLPASTRFLTQADFINWRLAGHQVASDSSNSLKSGYDLLEERWPVDVWSRLGIPTSILPEVTRPGTFLGTIGTEAAEATGLRAGTAIRAGMTDGCAAQIAAGSVTPGSWNSVLGTTLVLKGVSRDLLRDRNGVVYSHRSPDGLWLPGGASSTGAGILTQKFRREDLVKLDSAAEGYEPSTVVSYPLASKGERFPFMSAAAHGFTSGTPRDEADHYASLLQGVAYVERLSFDYLSSIGADVDGTLTFTGGATRGRYWTQLRADILGRSVYLPETAEPAFGMAVLAAAEGENLGECAQRMTRLRECIEPRQDKSKIFLEPYLKLVREFQQLGWISSALAAHAERRAGAQ